MAVSQPSNQVNVWKKPIGVKLVKKWGLSRSLDVFHAFFKNDQVAELMLISIKVQESAGTLRLLVRVDDTIRTVIQTALRSYSRQGRFPVLGSNNFDDFFLYCANSDFIVLMPLSSRIPSLHVCYFVFYPSLLRASLLPLYIFFQFLSLFKW